MKMVKKILLGLALAGTVLALAGCSMGDDKQMDKDGDKWDFTATVDHINIDKKKGTTYATDKLYQRAWTQLGNKESVSKIKTTLTIYSGAATSKTRDATDLEAKTAAKDLYKKDITANPTANADKYYTLDSTGTQSRNAVVGFLFDLHKTTVNSKTVYDFVLLGIQVSTGKYYVERYTNVPENAMKDPTSLGSLWSGVTATTCTFLDGKNSGTYSDDVPYCATALSLKEETDEDGNKYKTLDVEITQETKGTYVMKFGGKTIEYTRDKNDKDKKDGTLIGGAGVYSNAPLGTIAIINSHVDKDKTEGLYEEVEE